MNNVQIRQFETQLYELINGVSIPTEVKRLVIENVLLKLTTASDNDIRNELESTQNNNPNRATEDVPGVKGERNE